MDERSDVTLLDNSSALPVCFFLQCHLDNCYRTFNTKLANTKIAQFYYNYFVSIKIDLVHRVKDGEFLTSQEYEDFKRYCHYKVTAEYKNPGDTIISFSSFSDKQIENLIHATRISAERVLPSTTKARMRSFAAYIDFLYEMFHYSNNVSVLIATCYNNLKEKIKRDTQELKDINSLVRDPYEQVIPDAVYFHILDIIQPWHENNPWKGSRLRNQLIIQILNETGIRVGALCKLKISDLRSDWHNPRCVITRTPNDPTDPRKRPASQKTKAHVSALMSSTLTRLLLYIETERAKYPIANTHEFIFVSEKGATAGKPLAMSSVNYLMKVLSKMVNFHLYPHLFRHKWNEVFEDRAQQAGYSHEQINDMRNYACGWSENSKMVKTYNEFKLAVQASELSKIRQSEFIPSMFEFKDSGKEKS